MAAKGRPPKPKPQVLINLYGLERLGLDDIPMTGNTLADQVFIEMLCFRIGHTRNEGGLGKFGHFKRIVDLVWNNPDLECSKRFIWNPWAEKMFRTWCDHDEVGVAGATSAGKSDPLALWLLINYISDPTHTMVMMMSTSLKGAKHRIWGKLREYWEAAPDLPGKTLWSTNEILGPNYKGDGYGNSSGIYLVASEQSNEKSALDKLIGIKAPRTGESGLGFAELMLRPEYARLRNTFDDEVLATLVPRLHNLSNDRIGKLILGIDEATGCAASILNVVQSNLKPGNAGHFQVIMLANPNSHFDTFGTFCTPGLGWQGVTINDEEWETATGGICIRFNGEKNPRIVDKNEKLNWMLTQDAIDDMRRTYGRESLYYYRMCLGMWSPHGTETGVYSEADLMVNGCLGKVTWGMEKPALLSALDPGFTAGGDRSSCTFGRIGRDTKGVQVLERTEEVRIEVNPNDTRVPVSYQTVANWRRECEKRGVPPENCCCDITGALAFGDIIRQHWSPRVLLINVGGKAPKTPVGKDKGPDGKLILNCERYSNMSTYIWYGAMPFLRSGQIRGVDNDLAKEICSRQHDEGKSGSDGRGLKIESKKIYKGREGKSPDLSDSFFLLVELAKQRFRFRPSDTQADSTGPNGASRRPGGAWAAFCARARRLTPKRGLKTHR